MPRKIEGVVDALNNPPTMCCSGTYARLVRDCEIVKHRHHRVFLLQICIYIYIILYKIYAFLQLSGKGESNLFVKGKGPLWDAGGHFGSSLLLDTQPSPTSSFKNPPFLYRTYSQLVNEEWEGVLSPTVTGHILVS